MGPDARLADRDGRFPRSARLSGARSPPVGRGARDPGHRPDLGRGPGAPRYRGVVRAGGVPVGGRQGARRDGSARHAPHGIRVRRRRCRVVRPRLLGARGRRQRVPELRERAGLALHVPDLAVRLRRAEGALAAADGPRRSHRLLRPHRARRRLGPVRDAHGRPARRGGLGAVGDEDVDHQRQRRRRRDRLGEHRRGRPRVPGPDGGAGVLRERTSTGSSRSALR